LRTGVGTIALRIEVVNNNVFVGYPMRSKCGWNGQVVPWHVGSSANSQVIGCSGRTMAN